jgi:putative NIF3 family GTP cyclohydrolase 1 type 2
MKAREINEHLNSLVDIEKEKTVDRVIYGDPDAEVKGIAVSWMPYEETIRRAADLGANVLVTHEPTFYVHYDLDDDFGELPEFGRAHLDKKKKLIEDVGVTIIRCHDVWDAIPEIGIPFAWGRFLGFEKIVNKERFYNIYQVPEITAGEFAKDVAAKTKLLGQPVVGFYGDPEKKITKVGVGTGCGSSPFKLYELGAELSISVDDIVRAWIAGGWAMDTGRPLVVVNHCVSEEPGMVTLAEHLQGRFKDIKVSHIRQGCSYQMVS